jgi:hypothetical protein
MLSKFKIFLITAVAASGFFPVISLAQLNIDMPYALSNELVVEIIPTYPKPYENVFLSLSMYTEDLNSATITWHKDGKSVLSGKGEARYSFKAGAAGEETSIEIVVKLLNGNSFSKSFRLNPASVDLVWEADTYVPPFYKGKALHSRQGALKIVAMPEFVKNRARVSPSNLVYQWSNGLEGYQGQSGYGKSTLVINGSILGKTERVEVTVTDPTDGITTVGYLDIPPIDPEIVFYENNPYYGYLFNSAIASIFNLDGDEVQIFAAPYFFSKESGSLKYNWRLNGQSIPSLIDSRTAIFRKPEGESGQSNIFLSAENSSRILQQADKSLTINFEE